MERSSSSTFAPNRSTRAGNCPGAVHIPVEELTERLAELPADREITAYCRGQYCVLAQDAVRLLNRRGYRASRATDEALEWRIAGLLERDDLLA